MHETLLCAFCSVVCIVETTCRDSSANPLRQVRILSDANSWFINTILKANSIDEHVRQVVTNPAWEDGGRLRVAPYHTDPHPATSTSPPNLCKVQSLELIQKVFLTRSDCCHAAAAWSTLHILSPSSKQGRVMQQWLAGKSWAKVQPAVP